MIEAAVLNIRIRWVTKRNIPRSKSVKKLLPRPNLNLALNPGVAGSNLLYINLYMFKDRTIPCVNYVWK